MNPFPTPSEETLMILRERIGLQADDASQDVTLSQTYIVAIRWLEAYLDRWLVEGTYTEEFIHELGYSVSLRAYPVCTIESITNNTTNTPIDLSDQCTLNKQNGVLHFDTFQSGNQITIVYTMDDPFVGALYIALLAVFDQVWASLSQNSVTGTSGSGGVIKAISSDGASIQFDNSSSGIGGIDVETGLPVNILGMLDLFKREYC